MTKQQQFYITLNTKIKNKRFKSYRDCLLYLNQLLENNTLSYEDYWTLRVRADDVYKERKTDMEIKIVDYSKMSAKEIKKMHSYQIQVYLDMVNGEYSKNDIAMQNQELIIFRNNLNKEQYELL